MLFCSFAVTPAAVLGKRIWTQGCPIRILEEFPLPYGLQTNFDSLHNPPKIVCFQMGGVFVELSFELVCSGGAQGESFTLIHAGSAKGI